MTSKTLMCAVCGNEPAIGVFCVPGGPLSEAYGESCARLNIHPAWALRAVVECVGGVNAVSPEYLDLQVWESGKVITLRESLRRKPLNMEEPS